MTPALIDIRRLGFYAKLLNQGGEIDNLENIKGSQVYIFHGKNDKTVKIGTGKKLIEQYKYYGANVSAEFSLPAGHGFVSYHFF